MSLILNEINILVKLIIKLHVEIKELNKCQRITSLI